MHARVALLVSVVAMAILAGTQAAPQVGTTIADFRLPDHMGKQHALSDFADKDVAVVAFLGTECPLAKMYAAGVQKIADQYAQRGVAVVAIMSNVQDSERVRAAFTDRGK